MRKADLWGCDLTRANLSGVDLRGANLGYTIMDSVNLKGAKVTEEQLVKARLRTGITMPDGSKTD
ncbi:MAG: pentapeptide repeat-containing protein [Anaerolineae bacterium]